MLSPANLTNRALLAGVVMLTVTGLIGGVVLSPGVRHQLALTFSKQPTRFTELYFTHPAGLPTHLSTAALNTVSFTVVDHEGEPRSYPYTVTVARAAHTATIRRGTLRVGAGASRVETVAFIPGTHDRYRVVVAIAARRPEQISFRASS